MRYLENERYLIFSVGIKKPSIVYGFAWMTQALPTLVLIVSPQVQR
jgi:hypothetical protein